MLKTALKVAVIRKRKVAAVKCCNDILSLGNAGSRHEDANSIKRDGPKRVHLYKVGIGNTGRDAGSLSTGTNDVGVGRVKKARDGLEVALVKSSLVLRGNGVGQFEPA